MSLETFSGDAVPALLRQVRERLGPDAQVVSLDHRQGRYVLVATATATAPDFRPAPVRRPAPQPAPLPERPKHRPLVIALVGPTGAGKTTTIAKLATSTAGFGGRKVGIVGLDTYRIGAIEQLATWGEVTRMPVETAWAAGDAAEILAGYADRDVVLLDAPGRGPGRMQDLLAIRDTLAAFRPDETHLVLPAGRLWRVQGAELDAHHELRVTHLLASKLDECPDDWGVFELAHQRGMPMRWMTEGQQVPTDLRRADDRMAGAVLRRANLRAAREVA